MHAQKSKRVGRVGTRIDANDAGAVSGAVISGVVFGADPADASRGCEFEPFDEFRAKFRANDHLPDAIRGFSVLDERRPFQFEPLA